MVGWVGGWVAGFNENITHSAPNWVGLGLGAELGNRICYCIRIDYDDDNEEVEEEEEEKEEERVQGT